VQATRHVLPAVVGRRVHEVEDVAQALRGRRDDVEVALPEARLDLLELEAQGAHHLGLRHDVGLVVRPSVAHPRQHRARSVGLRGDAVGGEVGVLGLASGPAQLDVQLGGEVEHGLEPLLGQLVDGRGDAFVSHGSTLARSYLSMSPTTKNIEPRIATRSATTVPDTISGSTATLLNDAVRSLSRHGVFSPRETR
jgi:hypothetical protein